VNLPNRNVERGAATRERVLAIATRLFAERGYENTSIDAVLTEAGISKGSLYHHFKGKDALFEAVLEAIEVDAGERTVAAASTETDPVAALRAGCQEWVRMAGDPIVQRILLIDAPAVLGWERWRELEERHALGLIKAAMAVIADAGHLDHGLVDVFAHVVLAGMNEIALMVARAPDLAHATEAGADAVDEILRRLLQAPPA
jgi:AcrR family transcriptional regulator